MDLERNSLRTLFARIPEMVFHLASFCSSMALDWDQKAVTMTKARMAMAMNTSKRVKPWGYLDPLVIHKVHMALHTPYLGEKWG